MPSTPGSTASTETTADQSSATASTLTTVSRPPHNNTHRGGIGLVLIYCPDTDRVYAVVVGEATLFNGGLRVDPTANGQAKRIRWAADHELPA